MTTTETTPRTLLPPPPRGGNPPVAKLDREWLLLILKHAALSEGWPKDGVEVRALELRMELDDIVQRRTAFRDFLDLVFDPGGSPNYRPSLYTNDHHELFRLANAYDYAQLKRKDPRRAYRGGGK